MSADVLTIEQIKTLLFPLFEKYNIKSAILFGSYAKGCATANSDVDLLVNSGIKGMAFYGFAQDVEDAVNKEVDVFDVQDIDVNSRVDLEIKKTGVKIYG